MAKQQRILLLLLLTFSCLLLQSKADLPNTKGWEAITNGWFCQPGDYNDYKSRDQASYGLVLTTDNKFSQCVLNTATGQFPGVIIGCAIYDSNYKCLECDCNKGLSYDGTACLDNTNRVQYCAEYDNTGNCNRCKYTYNENIVDTSGNTKQFSQMLKLDFGLFNKQCYNNSDTNNIPNCQVYDDKGKIGDAAANCTKCHFYKQWTKTEAVGSQNYYQTPGSSPNFYKYRYFISQNSAAPKKMTCVSLPETYESDINNLKFLIARPSPGDQTKNQLYFQCADNFINVGSTVTSLTPNGFYNTTSQLAAPADGCVNQNYTAYYIQNGCYQVKSKNNLIDDCTAENNDYTISGYTFKSYTGTNLVRLDANTVRCTLCNKGTQQFDLTYTYCVDKNVDNCAQYQVTDTKGPSYICVSCTGVLLIDSKGTKCNPPIANCQTHDADITKCTLCQPLYILSIDQLTCSLQEEVPLISSGTTVGQIGCQLQDNDKYSCNKCDAQLGFELYGTPLQQCKCSNTNQFFINPAIPQICTKIDSSITGACNTQYMIDKQFGINRYSCSDCLKSYDHQYCSSGNLDSNNCSIFQSTSNKQLCAICISNQYSINDLGKCVDVASDDILNSGINNCDQVEYYIDRYEDNLYINCLKINTVSKVCTQCLDGFGLNTANKQICYINTTLLAANCSKLQNQDATKCQTCLPGFFQNDKSDTCIDLNSIISKCVIYASSTTCSQCAPNYGMSIDKKTCIQSTNCLQTRADDGNLCEKCNSGYVLNNDHKCYPYITVDNCLLYSDNKFDCIQCQAGYGFSTDAGYKKCITLPSCTTPYPYPDKLKQCQTCIDTYYPDTSGICQKGTIDGCISYLQTTTDGSDCVTCQNSYYISDDKKSCKKQASATNCFYPADKDKCTQCNKQFYISSGLCTGSDSLYLEGCMTYTGDSVPKTLKCQTCELGYSLQAGVCTKYASISPVITGCKTYSQTDSTKCIECDQTIFYYLSGTTCALYSDAVKTKCNTLDPLSNKCIQCQNEDAYYLALDGTCQNSATIPSCDRLIQSPATAALQGLCGKCASTYTFDSTDNLCYSGTPANPTNCIEKDSSGNCKICSDTYYFLSTSKVCGTASTKTAIANCGQLVVNPDDPAIDKCQLCKDMVAQFIQRTGNVYACTTRTQTNCATRSDTEDKCLKCSAPNGLSSDFKCLGATDTQCKTALITDNTKCSECNSNYQFKDGVCTLQTSATFKDIPNCIIFGKNYCISCDTNFAANTATGQCIAITSTTISNCAKVDPTDSTVCVTCNDEMYWDKLNKNCATPGTLLTGCKIYKDATTCLTCKSSQDATNGGKCGRPANCDQAMKGDPATCITCSSTYYSKDGGAHCDSPQVLFIANCYLYSGTMQCTNCLGNLAPDTKKTQCLNNINDNYCLQVSISSADACGICATGTTLKGTTCTLLTAKIDNCVSYSDIDTCSKCKPGYKVVSKVCDFITANCIDDDGTNCIQCAAPFLLDQNNLCVSQPAFTTITSVYDIKNYKMYKYCPLCKEGYTLNQKSFAQDNSNNMCIKNPPSHLPDSNCIQYDRSRKCMKCASGFTLLNDIYNTTYCSSVLPTDFAQCNNYEPINTLKQYQPNCLICKRDPTIGLNALTGKCEVIPPDKHMIQVNYLGNILWNRMMIQCADTYTFNQKSGLCEAEIPRCLAMYEGVCTYCKLQADYGMLKLTDTVSCYMNSELTTSNCALYIDKPATKADAVCRKCQFGYMLSDDHKTCKPVIANCVAFSWIEIPLNYKRIYCTDCLPQYRINYFSGQCEAYSKQKLSLSCAVVDAMGDCVICQGPYNLQNGICYLKIPNCQSQTADTCSLCLNGYVLSDNKCIYNQGCSKYSNGKCTQCSANCPNTQSNLKVFTNFKVWNWQFYGMDNNGKCVEGCALFDNSNTCTRCASYKDFDCKTISNAAYNLQLYYLTNGKCLRRKNFVKYCLNYDTLTDNCVNCTYAFNASKTNDQSQPIECTQCADIKPDSDDQACYVLNNNCQCTSCKKTSKSWFNKTDSTCNLRKVSTNCSTFDLNSDKCIDCGSYGRLDIYGVCQNDIRCFSWDNSNPSSTTLKCLGCDYSYASDQGDWVDDNGLLNCIFKTHVDYIANCKTYIKNQEVGSNNLVCSACKLYKGNKYYTLVNLEVADPQYKVQCVQQYQSDPSNTYPGCVSFVGEDQITCKTPEKSSNNCPKVLKADYKKWDCQSCYYFDKGDQYGLISTGSNDPHHCISNTVGGNVEGCQIYDQNPTIRCQNCWYPYQKVSLDDNAKILFDEAATSCQYINTFCRNIGCLILKKTQTREWPTCKICADNYDLNEGSMFCDLANVSGIDGGGVPQQSDDGTGSDGGLTALPKPPTPPVPKYSKFLTVGLEAIVLLALAIFAFLL